MNHPDPPEPSTLLTVGLVSALTVIALVIPPFPPHIQKQLQDPSMAEQGNDTHEAKRRSYRRYPQPYSGEDEQSYRFPVIPSTGLDTAI